MMRFAGLLVLLGFLSGCDTFFRVEGNLLQCGTTTAIAGATVTAATDPGAWDGPEMETTTTDVDGAFFVELNKPRDEAATVSFTKPGFASFSRDFADGVPSSPYQIDVCLDPSPPAP
jgi:hypothetical protein